MCLIDLFGVYHSSSKTAARLIENTKYYSGIARCITPFPAFFRWTPRRRRNRPWRARYSRRRRVATRRHPSAAATATPSVLRHLVNLMRQWRPKHLWILLLTQCIGSDSINIWECLKIGNPETFYVSIKEYKRIKFRDPLFWDIPMFLWSPWRPIFIVPII